MDLTKFKAIDQTIRATTIVAISCCLIMGVAFSICFFYLSNKIDEAYVKGFVLDTSGTPFNATYMDLAKMRPVEYKAHVKDFVLLWYEIEESTYDENIKKGLNLIGDKGRELLNDYNSVNMYNSLMQKNIRYTVEIKDVLIDTKTIPVSGNIIFTQTGHRLGSKNSRDLYVEFTLYDVSRSDDNTRGVKIGEWNVRYSEPQKVTD